MTYFERYNQLKTLFDVQKDCIQIPYSNTCIHNIEFISDSWHLLPGANEYYCKKHEVSFLEKLCYKQEDAYKHYPDILKSDDIDILENRGFSYLLFKNNNTESAKDVIILLHGLNEKSWEKYLPWAEKLVELTGKAVILFPIAFHMNRAPANWSNPRIMKDVASNRHEYFHSIVNSTFANAAISARVHAVPQRFFWSGLQTFYDIVKLVKGLKAGEQPLIDSSAKIDLFAYSIGSFLSEILLMANPDYYFDYTKLFIFCGGPTLDRMVPNSRYILDSDATIALYSFYTERIEKELLLDKRIEHFFNNDHSAGNCFKTLLTYQKNKEFRERRFKELSKMIYAVALKNDTVIPPNEVLNTLKGDYRKIPIKVDIIDFPFTYDHVNPFPVKKEIEKIVDKNFNAIFNKAAKFFSKS